MNNRSNLSFEPFLTPEELFKNMVQVYLDEKRVYRYLRCL